MIPLLFLGLVLTYILYFKFQRSSPPGPIPLPFFGNSLSLRFPAPGYDAFLRWKREYGPLTTFWMGTKKFVLISDYALMKETFVKDGDTFVDKFSSNFSKQFRGGNYGVVDSNGETWRIHRRFALTTLRDLGIGKDLMQMKILIEVEELFKNLDNTSGLVDFSKIIDRAVGNVINQTLFGYRFDETSSNDFEKLKGLIDSLRTTISQFRYFIQMLIPILSKVIPGTSLHDVIEVRKQELNKFFDAQIEKHIKEINFDDDEVSDYVEGYLKEQKRREDSGDFESFNTKQLRVMCFDMWLAGLVTTTLTLTWGFAYYLNYPKVRKEIQKELDQVINGDRLVTTADKNDLPYLNAFITETQRCANMFPMNLQHETTRDTVINGYQIKAGTGIIAQIATVMFDEKVFPNPYEFEPSRFIDEQTGKFKKIDEVIPFSIGKRVCLGEGLARQELFLFFANVFNRYEILAPEVPSIDKTQQSIVMPRKFNAKLTRRHI